MCSVGGIDGGIGDGSVDLIKQINKKRKKSGGNNGKQTSS
jgi:hypothetical protein